MNIELSILVAVLALGCSIISVVSALRRNNKKSDKEQATEMTTVIVKLENISNDIKDVKNDLKDLKVDLQKHSERLTIIEERIRILDRAVFGENSPDPKK